MTAPTIRLRPYQEEAVAAVRAQFRQRRQALIVLPTGCGKTFTALSMISATVARGGRALWLGHRTELVEQPAEAWRAVEQFAATGSAGVVQASRAEHGADLVCASTQTLARAWDAPDNHLRRLWRASEAPIRLVVLDEAHRYADDGRGAFARLVRALGETAAEAGHPPPFLLGLTATPERTDGRGLTGIWGEAPAYVYHYAEAIRDGYLVEPRIILDRLELDEETRQIVSAARDDGDGVDRETARALLDAGLVEWTAEAMGRHLRGRRVLAYTCDVASARALCERLQGDGWRAAVVSGETPAARRREILRDMRAGTLEAVVNCGVLTEGTDIPIADAIVLARPFASKVLYLQTIGRGLRLYPGKVDCVVVDVLGGSEEHSLVHSGVMVEGRNAGPPEPFHGVAVRRVGEVPAGARVAVVPRPEAPEGDDRAWLLVALVLGEDHEVPCEPVPVHRPRDVKAEGDAGGVNLPDLLRERRRVAAQWLPVPGAPGVHVADCGRGGRVLVVDEAEGSRAWHVPRRARNPRALCRAPMDPILARALGDDLYRQASKLVDPAMPWRAEPPTEAQRLRAERERLTVRGQTRGAYADAITQENARRWWANNGHKCRAEQK